MNTLQGAARGPGSNGVPCFPEDPRHVGGATRAKGEAPRLSMSRTLQPEFGHARLERGRFEAKPVSCTAAATNAPSRGLEHAPDVFLLDVDEFRAPPGCGGRAMRNGDREAVTRRPIMARSTTFRSSRMLPGHGYCASAANVDLSMVSMRLAERLRELLDETPDQQGDVLGPFAQRRQRNGKHVQPIVEVFPERAVGYPALQIAMGRRNDPGVDPDRLRATQALDCLLLAAPAAA